jgi:uncharacterized protein DUF5681
MAREDGQFKPGQSGNPGGRSKGFATKIKELCGDDYEKIAEGLFAIAFGTAAARSKFFGETVNVTTKDRIAAAIALRDSGPGRPAQTLDHRGDAPQRHRVVYEKPNPVDAVTDEESDELSDIDRGVA